MITRAVLTPIRLHNRRNRMSNIREFKCTYSNSVGISAETTAGLGLEFPDAYMHSETMQILARAIKAHDKSDFVLLPFCRTIEAESLGAVLNYGDANTGPRAKDPICTSADEVLALPSIDFGTKRIHEVLDACRAMKDAGENVCLEITGPFTILNALMEPRLVFKAYRKDRDKMRQVFSKFSDELIRYIEEGKKAGVDIFIFSDSAGSLDILGPKYLVNAVEDFYDPFIRRVTGVIDDSCIFLLCPKFTYALIDTDHAEFVDHQLEEGIDFMEAMLSMKGKVKIAGQVCIKNVGVKLAHGRFREIRMK